MPGDAGYPAYLATRLANFYERAGKVNCLGGPNRFGSVTIVGAVSPPGGDMSEPVTVSTLSIVQVFWALDKKLAQKKHFPAINWNDSFTKYDIALQDWFATNLPEFPGFVRTFRKVLQEEKALQEIVQLVGKDSLSEDQKVSLEVAKMIREDYLMQNSFTEYDFTCPLYKTEGMLRNICKFYQFCNEALRHSTEDNKITFDRIKRECREQYVMLTGMKMIDPNLNQKECDEKMKAILDSMKQAFSSKYEVSVD